jgi:hypothetical protein
VQDAAALDIHPAFEGARSGLTINAHLCSFWLWRSSHARSPEQGGIRQWPSFGAFLEPFFFLHKIFSFLLFSFVPSSKRATYCVTLEALASRAHGAACQKKMKRKRKRKRKGIKRKREKQTEQMHSRG